MKDLKNLCRTKSQKGNIEAVSAILNILREYSEQNPDLRFHQILWNFGIFEWNVLQRELLKISTMKLRRKL